MAVIEMPPAAARRTTRNGFVPTGADAIRFGHVERLVEACAGPAGRPAYDSVVIVGGMGVTAYTFAARLARSDQFGGKVVLAGPPVVEDRRLKAGVSVRGYTADFMSYGLNCSQAELIRAFCQHTAGQPVATSQIAAMATLDGCGRWTFSRPGAWQMSRWGSDRPVMYGARNSRIAAGIRELIDRDGVIEVHESVTSLEQARSLATGSNPLVVNVTTNPGLLGNPAPKPKWAAVAAQLPFKAGRAGLRAPLASSTTFAPFVRRAGTIDVGYFTPFADPLSPEATWYGIMIRPVPFAEGIKSKERELDVLVDEAVGLGDAMGLEPVDPEETLGRAFVPAPACRAPKSSAPGTFELRRACTPWIAAYYADGMAGSAVGGLLAAEAILRGNDPYPAAARGLRRFRLDNWILWLETTKLAPIADRLVRLNVRAAMWYPHGLSSDHWSSHA